MIIKTYHCNMCNGESKDVILFGLIGVGRIEVIDNYKNARNHICKTCFDDLFEAHKQLFSENSKEE